nr:hypothetical protein [Janthinobacterium sp. Marseille]
MKNGLLEVFLRNKYKTLLSFIGVAITTFFFSYHFVVPQWEAQAVIRIARLPKIDVDRGDIKVEPLESVVKVIERMRQPLFLQDALKIGQVSPEQIVDAPRLRELASGNIEIKVRGGTKQEALHYLDAILATLKIDHDKIYQERMNAIRADLSRIETHLLLDKMLQKNGTPLLNKGLDKTISTNELLLLNILMQSMERMENLSNYKVRLQESLNSLQTYPTDFLGGVKASDNFVYPSKLLFAIFSLFIGIFFAFVILLRICIQENNRIHK